MNAQVRFEHTSPFEFLELPRHLQVALRKCLGSLAHNPLHPPATLDVVRIRDHPGFWRLRLADHRVIYRAEPALIEVWFIEHRTPETYERLGELP